MTSRKGEYIRIRDRIAGGEYELIDPLDYKILELLPEEGSMFADLYPLGETAKAITKKFGGTLKSHQIAQRLRTMQNQGLVVKKQALGTAGTAIWQITPEGKEVLAKWHKH